MSAADHDYEIRLDDKHGSVVHRTRAPQRTAILMVEAAGVTPTGD